MIAYHVKVCLEILEIVFFTQSNFHLNGFPWKSEIRIIFSANQKLVLISIRGFSRNGSGKKIRNHSPVRFFQLHSGAEAAAQNVVRLKYF